MKIIVDADACPVKKEILEVAKKYKLKVTMVLDTSHVYEDGYSEVITVDREKDSADFKIIAKATKGDIGVTQDYALASILLAKGCSVIHQNGFLYTEDNIDMMLMQRHINSKLRKANKRQKPIKKRTKENNIKFLSELDKLVRGLI